MKLFPNVSNNFVAKKRCRWMSLRGVPASVKECWWKLKAVKPIQALRCYVKIAAAMGVSVADIVNVASEPMVHLIDRDAIPVLWRGEKGGSAKLMAGTSGPDML
ncbi:Cro/CI family transcriptional regulator, partial [Salmonella enterica subsp. enterica serovar Heidelberg str. N189]